MAKAPQDIDNPNSFVYKLQSNFIPTQLQSQLMLPELIKIGTTLLKHEHNSL